MASMVKTVVRFGRTFAGQVAVSVTAALLVSALFTTSGPVPLQPARSVEAGKASHRVADGAVQTTVLRYDPQQQAALASLASFRPAAAPDSAVIPATVPSAVKAGGGKQALVLPPPRPAALQAGVSTSPLPAELKPVLAAVPPPPAADGWRIAGVEIPGSARLRRIVPSPADVLKTGDIAWTASTRVVGKVAELRSLIGL